MHRAGYGAPANPSAAMVGAWLEVDRGVAFRAVRDARAHPAEHVELVPILEERRASRLVVACRACPPLAGLFRHRPPPVNRVFPWRRGRLRRRPSLTIARREAARAW